MAQENGGRNGFFMHITWQSSPAIIEFQKIDGFHQEASRKCCSTSIQDNAGCKIHQSTKRRCLLANILTNHKNAIDPNSTQRYDEKKKKNLLKQKTEAC